MKFPVIYCDPAWTYETWSNKGKGRTAEHHYECLSIADIAALPVASLAADKCALFMWVTYPVLLDALEVGKAWGFDYKTCAFTWIKRTRHGRDWFKGMGYYTMSNAEPCLIFTKGSTPTRLNKGISQIIDECTDQPSLFPPIVSRIGRHSEKPIEAYRRIEQLFAAPYVELFARQRRAGWVSLGNEIDGRDLRESIPDLAMKATIEP